MTKPQLLIIGLCGYKQSGKDTVATLLHSMISTKDYPTVVRAAFADKLKQDVADIMGTSLEHIVANKKHPVIRHLLQWYGTEYARAKHGEDVWIQQIEQQLAKLPTKLPTCVIITDVRFLNEAAWIRGKDGVIIKVERAGQVSTDTHASEAHIKHIPQDWILYNDGARIESLTQEVRHVKSYIWERFKI